MFDLTGPTIQSCLELALSFRSPGGK